MAYPDGWQHRLAITIDHDDIDSDLEYWTLVFDQAFDSVLTSVDGPLDADGARASINGGGDIRFSSDEAGTTRLACDIRDWTTHNTPGSATCEVAVKVPSVSSSSDTTIYMWWGKSGETQPSVSDTYGQYNAYDSDHELVLPNGASSDRTSNQRSTTDNSITSGDATGKVGKATAYAGNGSGDRCTIGDTSDWNTILSYDHAFTIEGMWELDDNTISSPCILISKILSAPDYKGVSITYEPSSTNLTGIVQETHSPSTRFGIQNASFTWANNEWKHMALAYNGTSVASGGLSLYANGATTGSGVDDGTVTTTSHADPLLIGARNWGGPSNMREWDGDIDEIRISDVERSAAWIKASYNNLFNTSGFLSWGSIVDIDELTADDLTLGTPTLENPTLAEADDELTADDLTLGTPAFENPTIGQEHTLSADDLTLGAIILDNPALGQEHALSVDDFLLGVITLEGPTLGTIHNLIADDFTLSPADLDSPTIGQIHVLTVDDFTLSSIDLGNPCICDGTFMLVADDLLLSSISFDATALRQVLAPKRELLSQTIEATANYDYANGEDTEANVMSYPPSYSAGSCPEAVGTITINQTILEAGEGAIQTSQAFTGESGTTLTLSNTPVSGMLVTLSADGADLTPTTDYTVSGTTITKTSGNFAADVTYVATYWYEV